MGGTHMRGPFTRRRLLISGGVAAATVPLLAPRPAAASATGALKTLVSPVRVFDSRAPGNFFGRKLAAGDVVAVAVSGAYQGNDVASAVFVNVTVTATEGAGYLAVVGEDSSGEQPAPTTSNINWSTSGVTLANLALTTVGSENSVAIWCRGQGRAHVIVDVQGYVPFVT